MIRIIIADDHSVVRRGLKQIFDETHDLQVVDEASSGNELLDKVRHNSYDVVILDISMPGKDGLDTLKELKNLKPELPVLVFTVFPEEQYAVRILKAGAAGYLNKESEPEEMLDAIRKVSQGRKYISPGLAELLAANLDISGETPIHDSLSDREFQVMCMIASGKTISDIAKELSLSINTISTYRIRILEKLNLKNNAEITHYALKNRLVD
ncbi:MAG: DNA-binding response regulator [Ignavibacteria bacterium GWB2_35_12]|nr:MAG: DNA-binding response regulator [Ignavibacteria bacterium GWA2_35_8]OGU40860.1 MAG: DNA-binding response regulator [Ignavibacteria bacterium GWB2_35_12]OGU92712.1 MAG: DNA-binding response regulator [Ignavibacteria bacterium RIFOXYA2_FULL_35_10]OGV24687.1 MAG: DNA-binding response regulator [Ignavibacteria bacterium RIFOXYC2_FULL_35_21]